MRIKNRIHSSSFIMKKLQNDSIAIQAVLSTQDDTRLPLARSGISEAGSAHR